MPVKIELYFFKVKDFDIFSCINPCLEKFISTVSFLVECAKDLCIQFQSLNDHEQILTKSLKRRLLSLTLNRWA